MKIKSILTKVKFIGLITAAFAVGFASTALTVSKRVETIDLSKEENEVNETYLGNFVSRIVKLKESEVPGEQPFGLKTNFNNFKVEWPNNTLAIDGEITLSMYSIFNLDVTVDTLINYNGKSLDLGIGYVDDYLYVASKDLALRTSLVNRDEAKEEFIEMYDKIYNYFFNLQNEDGMKWDLRLDEIISSVLGKFKSSSSQSSGGTSVLSGFSINETVNDVAAYSTMKIGIKGTTIEIEFKFNKDSGAVEQIDIKKCQVGNIKVSGGLVCVEDPTTKVLPFNDPSYSYKKRGQFIDVFHYSTWIDDIFNLLKERKIGLDISGEIKSPEKYIGCLEATIDVDASRYQPFDLVDMVIGPELFGLPPLYSNQQETSFLESTKAEEGLDIVELVNGIDFNLKANLYNKIPDSGIVYEVDYSNLEFSYFKDADGVNTGYLKVNEFGSNSVIKSKIDVESVNYLIREITNLFKNASSTDSKKTSQLTGLISSTELSEALNEGKYDGILPIIENMISTENGIQIILNLSSLGLGENAKFTITLDASDDTDRKPIELSLDNVALGERTLSFKIATREFSRKHFESINNERNKYQPIDFVCGSLDLLNEISESKQFGISLAGSMLDSKSLGFDFNAWGEFDYGNKSGMASVTVNHYKYESGKTITPHKLDVSFTNFGSNDAKNNIYFEYRDTLRGKFTVQTIKDVKDLFSKLTGSSESSTSSTSSLFSSGALSGIIENYAGSLILDAIRNEDPLTLTTSQLLKNVGYVNDKMTLQIVLSGELLDSTNTTSDIKINLNFKMVEGKKRIDNIEIVDLHIKDKSIYFKLGISNYDATKANPVDLTQDFINFSDIAVLLDCGINTTKLAVYELKANIKLSTKFNSNATAVPLMNMTIDAYINVTSDGIKVYAKLPTNELNAGYSELTFDSSDGHFCIYRYEAGSYLNMFQQRTYYYYIDSATFMDNIMTCVMADFLGVPSSIMNQIPDMKSSGNEESDPHYENIFERSGSFLGFSYSHTSSKDQWKLKINLPAITDNEKLGSLDATIVATAPANNEKYITSATFSTSLASVLFVSGDVALNNINPFATSWGATTEAKYSAVKNIWNTLNATQKASAQNPKVGALL